MKNNSKEALLIMAIVLLVAFILIGFSLVADMWVDKREKITGFICILISIFIGIGIYLIA